MTNYINSITLEDGSTYNVGPLKIDDYDNIVSHNINLQSQQHSNVIIGNSSFELTPSTKAFNNNIIIGNPDLHLLEDSYLVDFNMLPTSSGNIVIGNSSNLVCITPTAVSCVFNGVSATINSGHIGVGPFSIGIHTISSSSDYVLLHGPTAVYAIGSCAIPGYTGHIWGYGNVSVSYSATQDNPCLGMFSVTGNELGRDTGGKLFRGGVTGYYTYSPIVGFCADSSDGVYSRLYFAACSNYSAYYGFNLTVYTYSWPAPV